MIDKTKLNLDIPDGMTVDQMRAVIVSVLDAIDKSNAEEEALTAENEKLTSENDRLGKQNLELFNRVTSSSTTQPKEEEKEEDEETVTTEEIVDYYSN